MNDIVTNVHTGKRHDVIKAIRKDLEWFGAKNQAIRQVTLQRLGFFKWFGIVTADRRKGKNGAKSTQSESSG